MLNRERLKKLFLATFFRPASVRHLHGRRHLRAGLSPKVAALTVNKVCGSGLKAVSLAAQGFAVAMSSLVVAGGMESMSQAGWVLPRDAPLIGDRPLIDSMIHDGLTCAFSKKSMGEIADALAKKAGISREEQDQFALESHRRAVAAIDAGEFTAEIVRVPSRRASEIPSRATKARVPTPISRNLRV